MHNAVKGWMLDQEMARVMIDEALARQQRTGDTLPLLDHDISRLAAMRVSPRTAEPNHALVVTLGIAAAAMVNVSVTGVVTGLPPLRGFRYHRLAIPGPAMIRRARTAALVGAAVVGHPESPELPPDAADDLHALADSLMQQHEVRVARDRQADVSGWPSIRWLWEL
jgi:hypothetical protein